MKRILLIEGAPPCSMHAWENSEIVTKGVRPPKAAAKLLELLNRYSAKERKD